MATNKIAPLIVIVGETGSGKSALALKLAKQFNGEIICADSRTVYKGMDIGTAKPTKKQQASVPHHLLDITTPEQPFTAADFQGLAKQAINDISARGRVPIVVGGSGLYVDGLLFDFSFRPARPAERDRLVGLGIVQLQALITEQGLELPANPKNPRHLQRVLETGGASGASRPLRPNTLLIGIRLSRAMLESRIRRRVDNMFTAGLVEEARNLFELYPLQLEALKTPGYTALRQLLAGQISEAQAKEEFVRSDLALAKRQRTWFKRNKSIHWITKQREAVDLTTTLLNK